MQAHTIPALIASLGLFASTETFAAQGRTPGQFSVSSWGATEYSVAIWTPPGPRGIQPHISIKYDSNAGIGPLGVGWSINGLGAIARCNKTVAQDGAAAPVALLASDGYCLNGSRLRLTSATGTYGADGSTYQTEIADFSKVTAHGTQGLGPAYFTVQGRDGLTYQYGFVDANGNGADSQIVPALSSTATAWMLSKVIDRAGNNYVINYTGANGAAVPDTILWTPTGAGATTYTYSMHFSYTPNVPQSSPFKYIAGTVSTTTSLLSSMTISSGTTVLKDYFLQYTTSAATGRYELQTITECADTGKTNCLLPTTVAYAPTAAGTFSTPTPTTFTGLAEARYDFNGDGIPDIVYSNGTNYFVAFGSATSGYSAGINTGISVVGNSALYGNLVNGTEDGILANNGGTWYYYTYNGTSFVGVSTGIPFVATSSYQLADINGDGRLDLIRENTVTSTTTVPAAAPAQATTASTPIGGPVTHYSATETVYVRLSTSSGGAPSFSATETVGATFSQSNLTVPAGGELRPPVGTFGTAVREYDFNGDKLDDLVMVVQTSSTTVTTYALISNGSTFTPTVIHAGSTFVPVYFMNWNDDACTDMVISNTMYVSGCNGTAAASFPVGNVLAAVDWDGDGRADLVVANGSTLGVYLSTGSNTAPTLISTSIPYVAANIYYRVDTTGSGRDDLGMTSTGGHFSYYPHNGTLDLATSITDGYGVSYAPTYVPLSASGSAYVAGGAVSVPDYKNYNSLQGTAGEPRQLVASYQTSDGIGGQYTVNYQYTQGVTNILGRGFQGFAQIRTQDSRSQFFDTVSYSTVFPTTGMMTADSVTQGDGTSVSSGAFTVATLTINPSTTNPQSFPYTSASSVNKYEVQPASSNGGVAGSYNGKLITTISKNYGTPDGAGNFTNVSTTVTDQDPSSPYTGLQWSEAMVSTIAADFSSNWCLSLPTEIDVTKTPPTSLGAPAITRHTTYLSPDYVNCRQTEQVIESGNTTYQVDTKYFYADSFGNMTSQTVTGVGMTARTSSVAYGTTGQFPVSSKNAMGDVFLVNVDANTGLLLSAKDPNGIQTSWQYDPFQRKAKEIRPDTTYTTWSYNSCAIAGCVNSNNRTTLVQTNFNTDNSNLNVKNTYLDQLDRALVTSKQMLNGAFDRNEVQYDNVGNILKQSAPCTFASCTLYWTVNSYDPMRRLVLTQRPVSATNASLQSTTVSFAGRETTIIDPLGKSTSTFTKVTGILGRTLDQNGYYVNFVHDAFGAVLSVTDSLGTTLKTNTYGYGVRAFPQTSVDMDLGAKSFTFDALGELTRYSDAKGQSFSTFYDPLSRPTQRIEPDLTTTWTWGTTAASHNIGRLASLSSVASAGTYSETYGFDADGRPASTTIVIPVYGSNTFNYAYSPTTGLPSTLTFPASTSPSTFRLKAQYNYASGILSQIVDANTPSTVWWQANATNPRGQITGETTEDLTGHPQIVSSRVYDAVTGWLSSNQAGVGTGATLQNESYLYDEDGNVTQRQNNNLGLTESFSYDGVNRLSTSHLGASLNLSITYDVTGNIARRSDVASGAVWTYDPTHKHQVTQAGSTAFTYGYDANGNVISRNGSLLTWTSYNYPSGVSTATESATFDYGPNRQRWRMIYSGANGTETTYYATPAFEAVATSAGTDYRHYIYANGKPVLVVSRTTAGAINVRSLLLDHQGSVATVVANATGATVANESFTAFGSRREATTWSGSPTSSELSAMNGVTRAGYTFQTVLGSMGLNHMNGRIEDSVTGRFLSADRRGIDKTSTQSFNRYSYVSNNPLTFTDPTGFDKDCSKTNDCPPPPFTGSSFASSNGMSESLCFGSCDGFNTHLEPTAPAGGSDSGGGGGGGSQSQATGYPALDDPDNFFRAPSDALSGCAGGSGCMTQQSLSANTIYGPTNVGVNGGYVWDINWELSEPSVDGGYIVQEIVVTGVVNGVSNNTHYWEAWHVSPGATVPDLHYIFGYDDQWSQKDIVSLVNGDYIVTGSAQFYEGVNLPTTFGVGFDPQSGLLPSTNLNPYLSSYNATFPVFRVYRNSWP
jgi:RHS repeat-associated protein